MDTERVCLALDVGPDVMSEVCRREAARLMREAARLLRNVEQSAAAPTEAANKASHWLMLSEAFDREYERRLDLLRGDGDDVAEATKPPNDAAAISAQSTPEDWSR
jgi:hypothetical protein